MPLLLSRIEPRATATDRLFVGLMVSCSALLWQVALSAMADTLALAAAVWAAICWLEFGRKRQHSLLVCGGLLLGGALWVLLGCLVCQTGLGFGYAFAPIAPAWAAKSMADGFSCTA